MFTRLANFLVVEIDKLDLDASGFTTCCVVEMTWANMPDSYKNFPWAVTASTDTFGCQQSSLSMLWGWWNGGTTHFTSTHCVRMCRNVRRTSYDVVRGRATSYAVWTPLKSSKLRHWIVLFWYSIIINYSNHEMCFRETCYYSFNTLFLLLLLQQLLLPLLNLLLLQLQLLRCSLTAAAAASSSSSSSYHIFETLSPSLWIHNRL